MFCKKAEHHFSAVLSSGLPPLIVISPGLESENTIYVWLATDKSFMNESKKEEKEEFLNLKSLPRIPAQIQTTPGQMLNRNVFTPDHKK